MINSAGMLAKELSYNKLVYVRLILVLETDSPGVGE
jgi:hypothetical protein